MRLIGIETVRLGLNNLRLHKLRSLLTSLGIIFGVAAVICMLSISEGASADELRLIELLGTKNIIISSVKPTETSESSEGTARLMEYGITRDDVRIIEKTIPRVAHVVPLKTVAYRARHGMYRGSLNAVGVTPVFFDVVNINVARGRPLSGEDIAGKANVCVIGEHVRRELFPFTDPLGETVLVERFPSAVPFTVVGILEKAVTAGAPARGVEERNLNREILIPFSTAVTQFGEITRRTGAGSREYIKVQCSGLYVTVDDLAFVQPVSRMVQRVLEHGHDQLDYEVRVPLARLQLAKRKERNKKLTLGFIAGISLLVGGIGIMNIMLATVTERTREIGIRRALGAKQKQIAVQFLVETVVLSTTGGVVGIALGVLGAFVITRVAEWETIVTLWSVAVSFCLSVLAGIFFGMYPALSAARLDPIEALRYE